LKINVPYLPKLKVFHLKAHPNPPLMVMAWYGGESMSRNADLYDHELRKKMARRFNIDVTKCHCVCAKMSAQCAL
jgi:hypothetical protein